MSTGIKHFNTKHVGFFFRELINFFLRELVNSSIKRDHLIITRGI